MVSIKALEAFIERFLKKGVVFVMLSLFNISVCLSQSIKKNFIKRFSHIVDSTVLINDFMGTHETRARLFSFGDLAKRARV